MSQVPIFNDYDEQGYRRNICGNRSTKIEDEAIVRNLRFRWKDELADTNDQSLVNCYDEFAMSDMFGSNDERFLEFFNDYFDKDA